MPDTEPTPPSPPTEGYCARCTRHFDALFPAEPAWGRVPSPLCLRCWSQYAEARGRGSFVSASDAFDNATDEQLEAALAGWGP